MTSATETLLRMLDERGIEHETHRDVKNRNVTKWSTHHGAFVFFAVEQEGKLLVETTVATEHSAICTPEQAIAATLGGGKLTAEQVRDAIERHSAWVIGNNRCFHNGAYEAIADELNAALGGGECEMEYGGDVTKDTARVMGVYFCSECGSPNYNDCMPYYCIYCGKAVKR